MSDRVEKPNRFRVGCSGWSYEDWVGPFYPKGSRPGDYLQMYSSVFDAVEIDSSFYRIPNQFMISKWNKNTPQDFVFCPKFPKKITHEFKLQNVASTVSFFYRTLAGLGDKLGPLVIQLPPSFKYDKGLPILEKFIASDLKTSTFRHAIEFRHKSWYRDDVYKLLESNNVSFCWSINQYSTSPTRVTSDFIYTRMVGERDITKFDVIQKDRAKQMKEMSDAVKSSIGSVDDAFIFFNNHFAGFGPESVNEFRRLLGLMEMDFGKTKLPTAQEIVRDQSVETQKSLIDF
ncbi:MAG: DUF72 domain-containing protein [Thaumarchaeota archaeon]|nr:DUF72 domain-containing protein [Nitrososphaerota archaeon]